MTRFEKSEIKAGMLMTKDCGDAVFNNKSPSTAAPSLPDIAKKLERVRKKLAVLQQVAAQNRR